MKQEYIFITTFHPNYRNAGCGEFKVGDKISYEIRSNDPTNYCAPNTKRISIMLDKNDVILKIIKSYEWEYSLGEFKGFTFDVRKMF